MLVSKLFGGFTPKPPDVFGTLVAEGTRKKCCPLFEKECVFFFAQNTSDCETQAVNFGKVLNWMKCDTVWASGAAIVARQSRTATRGGGTPSRAAPARHFYRVPLRGAPKRVKKGSNKKISTLAACFLGARAPLRGANPARHLARQPGGG